uniref:Uncharacterized protein n=1 Tax=Lactuca sativa TaxID=4236 RepID=A0A9R1V3E1_LACSA|nr:hypothetical protein LSAT_V11C700349980 [Lactuca sativa]
MIERVDFHDSDAFPCFPFFNLMKRFYVIYWRIIMVLRNSRGCTLITIDKGCCFYGFRTSKIYVQLPQIMLISPPIEPHHIHRTTDANFALALRSGKSFQLEIR